MGAGWYEELRQEASLRLEPNVFDWLVGGSEREESLHSAHDAWSEARLLPDAGFDVTEVDLSTSVLGRRVEPLSPWYRPGSTASCTPRRTRDGGRMRRPRAPLHALLPCLVPPGPGCRPERAVVVPVVRHERPRPHSCACDPGD